VILLLRPGHCLVENSLFVRIAAGWSTSPGEANSRSLGQHGQRLGERHVFHLHHEAEDVAADVAHPALKGLALGIDLQAGL
jgi:hypothetical protein